MAAVERFEDLLVWQRARELTTAIYGVSSDGRFAKDWGLSGQIQRSAVSVMSNIAEGFDRFRRGEFMQFLSIAKGSCAEVRSQLYVARDLGYIDHVKFQELLDKTNSLSRQIGALRTYIEKDLERLTVSRRKMPSAQNSELRTP